MNKERIIEIVNSLEIDNTTTQYEISRKIEKLELEDEVICFNGVTKNCPVFKKENFVLKWAYKSSCFTESLDEAIQECEIYQKAKEQGIEKFFPRTEFFADINEVSFIMQEKIDYSCADCSIKTKEKYSKISKTATDKIFFKMQKGFNIDGGWLDRDLDSLWAKMAIVLYGKKMCKKLCSFIQENKINDLHGNNLGYKNNHPIILDFSGYHRS